MKDQSRTPKGQFTNGATGNPAGRPAGSRNKATLACEQLLDGKAEQLTAKAVEMAMKGNVHAMRLCMERLLPARKERCINLESRPVSSAQDLPIQFQDIAAAVANGRITPGEGASLADILTSHARIMEFAELDRRVAQLEDVGRDVQSYRHDLKRFVEQIGHQAYTDLRNADRKKE